VEVRIGVAHVPREVVVEVTISPDEVTALITAALAQSGGLLILTDDKGRTIVVPGAAVGYVEMGPPSARRVGFAG